HLDRPGLERRGEFLPPPHTRLEANDVRINGIPSRFEARCEPKRKLVIAGGSLADKDDVSRRRGNRRHNDTISESCSDKRQYRGALYSRRQDPLAEMPGASTP